MTCGQNGHLADRCRKRDGASYIVNQCKENTKRDERGGRPAFVNMVKTRIDPQEKQNPTRTQIKSAPPPPPMPTKVKTVGKDPVVRFTGFPTQTRPASPVPKRRKMTVLKVKDHQEHEEHQTDQEDTWSTGSIEARMSKTDNGRWLVDSGSSDDFLSKNDVTF